MARGRFMVTKLKMRKWPSGPIKFQRQSRFVPYCQQIQFNQNDQQICLEKKPGKIQYLLKKSSGRVISIIRITGHLKIPGRLRNLSKSTLTQVGLVRTLFDLISQTKTRLFYLPCWGTLVTPLEQSICVRCEQFHRKLLKL